MKTQIRYFARVLGLLLLFSSQSGVLAQSGPGLASYLREHRYRIELNDTEAFSMLPSLMQRRNVLISGEGVSHDLKLYDTLQQALIRQLRRQHLKVALIEFGHDLGYLYNCYLSGDTSFAGKFQPGALLMYRPFVGAASFRVAGIDFERAGPFHFAVTHAMNGIDTNQLHYTRAFVRNLLDARNAGPSEKEFSTHYKSLSSEFDRLDSLASLEFKDRFAVMKYLCTNRNITTRYEYRDPAMAANFLREIAPYDTSATYYCEIGSAHSKTDNRGSMAALLGREPMLEDRIIVMNTYCENCRTEDGPTKDSRNKLSFMKGDRLQAFRDAALGDITLFDLRGLDANINSAGALLLFVRNHD